MGKTTYLLGAGASANEIPIDSNLAVELKEFIKFLRKNENQLKNEDFQRFPGTNKFQTQTELINDLEDLAIKLSGINQQGKIDTRAYAIRNKETQFRKLKIAVTCFFLYLERKGGINPRYNNVMPAWIGDTLGNFRDDIRVLSWNYDIQIERAIGAQFDMDDFEDIQTKGNFYTKFQDPLIQDQGFEIIKLNGSATIFDGADRSKSFYFYYLSELKGEEFVEKICEAFAWLSSRRIFPGLSFAFEEFGQQELLKRVEYSIQNTERLIVIGYSFPPVNQHIDKKILSLIEPKYLEIYDFDPNSIRLRMNKLVTHISNSEVTEHEISRDSLYAPFPTPPLY